MWKFGNVRINLCTPETIAYVAKYVLKKMTGQLKSSKHVTRYGEEVKRDSGFFLYSLRPGIGAYISDDVCKQFLRDGYIVYKNARLALPRYIKIVLARRFPLEYDAMIDRLVDSSKKLDFEAREVRENKGFQSDRARSKIAEKLKSLSSDKSKF